MTPDARAARIQAVTDVIEIAVTRALCSHQLDGLICKWPDCGCSRIYQERAQAGIQALRDAGWAIVPVEQKSDQNPLSPWMPPYPMYRTYR